MKNDDLIDLQPATQKWVREVCRSYELESHHEKLLLICARAWDRMQEARRTLVSEGLTFVDEKGNLRPHPCVKIENDSSIRYARALRELDLDAAVTPATPRPPALRSNRR